MAIIVAAHADDELLGWYLGLKKGLVKSVLYPLPMSSERNYEATRCGQLLGFTPVFGEEACSRMLHAADDTVYVPAPTDKHAEHQEALTWAVQWARADRLFEYSIEKDAPYVCPLKAIEVAEKREAFGRVYASQVSDLTDPKYFLFEGTAKLGVPSITVTLSRAGKHTWPGAPDEVAFLRTPHRHRFHVRLTLRDLFRSDRQFEFFLVQRWAEATFAMVQEQAPMEASCEYLARALALLARAHYTVPTTVSVWEDNENGAEVSI